MMIFFLTEKEIVLEFLDLCVRQSPPTGLRGRKLLADLLSYLSNVIWKQPITLQYQLKVPVLRNVENK